MSLSLSKEPSSAAILYLDNADLLFPDRKRALLQTQNGHATLYVGAKEIVFEGAAEIDFAARLAQVDRFNRDEALSWSVQLGPGRVERCLQDLLASGVLSQDFATAQKPQLAPTRECPSPLTAALAKDPQSLAHDPKLLSQLGGFGTDYAFLEMVVPVFRVAHATLDQDGRQVGEANVFPKPLRLNISTQWRACPHAGTRYQSDKPMNITALRSMRVHWAAMMHVLHTLRGAYLSRFPLASEGWTVASIERLTTLVLAVTTYATVRGDDPVANGDLDPVLSSLFRIADGLRMTVHQMLFVPGAEPNLLDTDLISSSEIFDYAERNYNFHSEHGVCAGPASMIKEFLSVLLDGQLPRDDAPVTLSLQVQRAMTDVKSAFDYGLLGLQTHFVTFSMWSLLARAYDELGVWSKRDASQSRQSLEAIAQRVRHLSYHQDEPRRKHRLALYSRLAIACNDGLAPQLQSNIPQTWLDPALKAEWTVRLKDLTLPSLVAETVAEFAISAHAVLSCGTSIQRRINSLLSREDPGRAFREEDLHTHLTMQGSAAPIPPLTDTLKREFGLDLSITSEAVSARRL